MKKRLYILAALLPILAVMIAGSLALMHVVGARAAATCLPTGYIDPAENIPLTAAVIATGNVTGTIDATGCDIGVYYGPHTNGAVKKADVFGATRYGIVNNGANVNITFSSVHDIGDKPFDGVQRGLAIYFSYDSGASGTISENKVYAYQKNGITVDGSSNSAKIEHNTVLGQGTVNYIAQNGIEVGFGSKVTVGSNNVSGNSYTGSGGASSGGILVVGGSCYGGPLEIGTKVTENTLTGNDVGLFLSNLDTSSCVPTTIPTRLYISENVVRNDAVNNTSGYNPGGYQAGISDQGDYDKIVNNRVCGIGYTAVPNPPPYLYMVDTTVTNNPILKDNKSCKTNATVSSPTVTTHVQGTAHKRANFVK